MTSFVLVPSPFVGPATWTPTADELRRRGHDVRDAPSADAVLVGHSGAGPLLPSLGPATQYLFVDAALPHPGRSRFDVLGPDVETHLRAIGDGESVPPWSEWFGPGVLDALVPDAAVRRAIAAELHRIPLSLLTEPLPTVAGWPDAPCAYLQLSAAYDVEAAEARAMGWPVEVLDGQHLDTAARPVPVADAIERSADG